MQAVHELSKDVRSCSWSLFCATVCFRRRLFFQRDLPVLKSESKHSRGIHIRAMSLTFCHVGTQGSQVFSGAMFALMRLGMTIPLLGDAISGSRVHKVLGSSGLQHSDSFDFSKRVIIERYARTSKRTVFQILRNFSLPTVHRGSGSHFGKGARTITARNVGRSRKTIHRPNTD